MTPLSATCAWVAVVPLLRTPVAPLTCILVATTVGSGGMSKDPGPDARAAIRSAERWLVRRCCRRGARSAAVPSDDTTATDGCQSA